MLHSRPVAIVTKIKKKSKMSKMNISIKVSGLAVRMRMKMHQDALFSSMKIKIHKLSIKIQLNYRSCINTHILEFSNLLNLINQISLVLLSLKHGVAVKAEIRIQKDAIKSY